MEKILNSDELGQHPVTFGGESGSLDLYDNLSSPFSEDVIRLVPRHTRQVEIYAQKAAENYGPDDQEMPEPTHAQTVHGVPSMVVRVDCTLKNGDIFAYEMEDSPSGQGITDKIHRHIGGAGIRSTVRDHYVSKTGQIPLVIVLGARMHGTDDAHIVGDENYVFDVNRNTPVPKSRLVIVKAIPGDLASTDGYLQLQKQAVAPLESEGDKTYLERIKSLAPVIKDSDLIYDPNTSDLSSQVVKARLGSMAMGVSIYLNPSDRKLYDKKGTKSASRLKKDAETFRLTKGGALTQAFVPPIQFENNQQRRHAIMRIFVLLSRPHGTIQAEAIGGCYVARPELTVHGASNAVGGAVIIEKEDIPC